MSRKRFLGLIEKSSNMRDEECLKLVIPEGSIGFFERSLFERSIKKTGCEMRSYIDGGSYTYYIAKSFSKLPLPLLEHINDKINYFNQENA
jgi:hypothetical protein